MNVEYTGRQYEITPIIRKEVETGLNKIRKGPQIQDQVAEQEAQGGQEIQWPERTGNR